MRIFNLLVISCSVIFFACKKDYNADSQNIPPVINDSTAQQSHLPIDSVGNIFHYTWADTYVNNTFWFHHGSASTVTAGNGYTNVDGGKADFSQHIVKLGAEFGPENFTIKQKIVVTSQSKKDLGLAIGLKNANQLGATIAVYHLLGDSCYISFHNNETLSSSFASNLATSQFKLAIGDTVQLEFVRRRDALSASMLNLSNGTSSKLSYAFILSPPTAPLLPAMAFFKIYQLGGHYHFVDSIQFRYDEPQAPEYAFLGDSIGSGYGASLTEKRNASLVAYGFTKSYIVYAGPGERAEDAEARMIDFVQHFKTTKAILFEYGVNDVNGGDSRDSAGARYTRTLSYAKNAGMHVIVVSPFPQDKSVQWMIDTMQSICSRLKLDYINDYSALKSPSGIGPQSLYTSDGVHPNDLGHAEKARVDRSLLQKLGYFLKKD